MRSELETAAGRGTVDCDCLVIGSGAGGALTAAFLAEHGYDVLILEEGPYVQSGTGSDRLTESLPSLWREGGFVPIASNASFMFAEGRCVGGSTMVNAGLINRIHPDVAIEWAESYHIQDFSFDMLERYEGRIERELGAAVLDGSASELKRRFNIGAARLGYAASDVPVAVTLEDGRLKKMNMQETFLKRAFARGARIAPNFRVERINVRSSSAVSVRAFQKHPVLGRQPLTVTFKRLYVCAGALQTPLLLRRSGIRRRIGDSLKFHPSLRVLARFDCPVRPYWAPMSGFQIKHFAPDVSMGISLSLPPFLASGLTFNWPANLGRVAETEHMGMYYVMTRSHTDGRVRNLPGAGNYLASYKLNRADLAALSKGYADLCELLFEAGAVNLFSSIEGLPEIASPAEIRAWREIPFPAKRLNAMSIHAFSSCPMGEDERRCPVDSYGKVRGTHNVFVHDASLLPSAPGVNPQGPIMAIVLRNLEAAASNI